MEPSLKIFAGLPRELLGAIAHKRLELDYADRLPSEGERWRGRPRPESLLGRGVALPKGGTALPCCREEWLVLLRAIYGPGYTTRLPASLGRRLDFVAGEAPGRSRAAHLAALAGWLAAPGPGGAPRRAALGYLSVTLPGEDGQLSSDDDSYSLNYVPPEEAAALCGVLEAVQGAQRLVFLELRSVDDGQGTALAGNLLQLPALRELVLGTYAMSITGSLAQLGCLTRLTVRSARLEAALPAGLRQLEVQRGVCGTAGFGGEPPRIPGGLSQLERLVVGAKLWHEDEPDQHDPLDVTALSEMERLTHLELVGRGPRNCFAFDALPELHCLRRLLLSSVYIDDRWLHLTGMPDLEASCTSHGNDSALAESSWQQVKKGMLCASCRR